MKNVLKKSLALILVFALSLSGTFVSYAQTYSDYVSEHDLFVEERGLEFVENYFRSIELLEFLLDAFPQDNLGRNVFPENLGGVYIDDYGNLVILVVENYLSNENNMFVRALVSEGVVAREVAFAYNDLWEVFDFLNDFIPNNQDNLAASNADGIWLNVIGNQVVVTLAEYTEEQVNRFREMVLDSPILGFMQSPGRPTSYIDYEYSYLEDLYYNGIALTEDLAIESLNITRVYPGDILYLRRPNGTLARGGSIGYRVRINIGGRGEQVGFTTAAHIGQGVDSLGRLIRNGDRVYNRNGTHIGTVQITHRDTADVAVITMAPNIQATNITLSGSVLPRQAPSTVGVRVIATGMSGLRRVGYIRGSWAGNTGSGWTNGMRASYTSQRGDSGGMVYSWTSATNNGVNGIHVTGWREDENFSQWADGGNALFTVVNIHFPRIGNSVRLY